MSTTQTIFPHFLASHASLCVPPEERADFYEVTGESVEPTLSNEAD
jgi:hypothetical protein